MSTADVLDLATLRSLSKEERAAALRSLLSGPDRPLARDIRSAIELRESPAVGSERLDESAQDRILRRVHEYEMAQELEERDAEEALARLLAQPAPRRETLVRNSERYQTYSLCLLLHKESVRQLFRAPEEGLALARLAVEIAEDPDLLVPSETLRSDVRGRSWAFLGNALRARFHYDESEQAFRTARKYLGEGSGDPLERAKLLDFEGQLRLYQRRFAEALRAFNRAERIYLAVGDRHLAGGVLVNKGLTQHRMGEVDAAIRSQRQALEWTDPSRDLRLHVAARHNLVYGLIEAGSFEEAAAQIPSLRDTHKALGDEITLIRVRSLEAAIAEGLGHAGEALRHYEAARGGYVAHSMVLDVAMTTLDMAAVYLRLNRTQETKQLASESLPLFRSLGLHREALAAFVAFQQAAEREVATLELVAEVTAYLRASRSNPELKFRG